MEALNIEEIAKKATNVVKMSPKGSEADFEKRLKENEILGKSTISKEERNTLLLTKREEEKKRKLELKEKAREEKIARWQRKKKLTILLKNILTNKQN